MATSTTKNRILDSESSPAIDSLPETPKSITGNKKTVQTIIYILGWYLFSLSISIYNKWMFGSGLDFKFPMIITSFHQLCLFVLSSLLLYFIPHLRPSIQTTADGNNGASRYEDSDSTANENPLLVPQFHQLFNIKFSVYMKQIFPCSITSAGDIGVSNVSITFVTLSLYTMLKTSSLIFVLIFGLLFQLERFNWRLIMIVVIMFGSVVMMVKRPEDEPDTEDKNHIIGMLLVLFAAMMSGLRWSFTQILLKNNPRTPNSITTIFYLSPAMCIIMFVSGILVEGWSNFVSSEIWHLKGVVTTIALMIIPGLLAFMMTLCEFKLLSVTQVITLSIAGIFKELLTIVLSSMIFGDKLSFINILGLIITFLDILWYNWFRYHQNSKYIPVNDQIEMGKL